jgi:hypothetical protein
MGANVPVAWEMQRESHWWDDHPPADPATEPLYAEALAGHLKA